MAGRARAASRAAWESVPALHPGTGDRGPGTMGQLLPAGYRSAAAGRVSAAGYRSAAAGASWARTMAQLQLQLYVNRLTYTQQQRPGAGANSVNSDNWPRKPAWQLGPVALTCIMQRCPGITASGERPGARFTGAQG